MAIDRSDGNEWHAAKKGKKLTVAAAGTGGKSVMFKPEKIIHIKKGFNRSGSNRSGSITLGIDFDAMNISEKANPHNFCGGMHSCRDRSFDTNKTDCQECLEDSSQAIEDSMKPGYLE
jgi:hypothetical protein